MSVPHAESIERVCEQFSTCTSGLIDAEVQKRHQSSGYNVLPSSRARTTTISLFFHQWKSPLIIILLIAGVVSGVLGESADMIIIFATAVINASIGFFQEYKASNALEKLQRLIEDRSFVIRDGAQRVVPTKDIVVGDILQLSRGQRIAADGRVIEAVHLEVNEAPLTGESAAVKKHTRIVGGETPLADRVNMVYRGTTVVGGRGLVVVTAIGKDTEIGRIANLVADTQDAPTPLQSELARLAKQLGVIVVVICFGILIVGMVGRMSQYTFIDLFQTAVAVAVAAIPEGLVISLTVILAIGMQQILKRRALVRRLLAAETLGSVSVICTDKTGTLTEGQMSVTELVTPTGSLNLEDLRRLHLDTEGHHTDIWLALRIATLCNEAALAPDGTGEGGGMTDMALARSGHEAGLHRRELEAAMPRVAELPFSSERKLMATVHRIDHEWIYYVKGAPERIIERATHQELHGEPQRLTQKERQWFVTEAEQMADRGLRVLCAAYRIRRQKPIDSMIEENEIGDLVLVALFGLSDPVRADVPETIQHALRAGIRTIMVTGDHARTAKTIAHSIGLNVLHTDGAGVVDGPTLDRCSDDELTRYLRTTSVFARVSPEHKIRIVRALQKEGEVVAMTGDGVNDAPALKAADIGVAVGSGTDVAKDVADLILLDDSFTTIVAAIEEGRRIYQNIKKVILYLLVGSLSEVLLIIGSIIGGLPLALLPAQILWMNIIQESFPTMALAFDRGERENMEEPPRRRENRLFDRVTVTLIAMLTLVTNVTLFSLFWYMVRRTNDVALSRTVVFAGLAVASLMYIYATRSLRRHVWAMPLLDNSYLTAAVGVGWLLIILAIYVPVLQSLLHTVPLLLDHWVLIVGFGFLNIFLIEGMKAYFKKRLPSVTPLSLS